MAWTSPATPDSKRFGEKRLTRSAREGITTIAAQRFRDLDHVVRLKISWSAYEAFAESLGDDNHVRLAYDGETLEITSPGSMHEFVANLVSDMLTVASMEWEVALTNIGSAPIRTHAGTFEADKTYYVNAKNRLRNIKAIDLSIDPPPDLVVEIDITNDSSRKFRTIYAAAGVPEVWLYTSAAFTAYGLLDGAYVEIETSRIVAGLPIAQLASRLAKLDEAENDILAFRAQWHQWLRAHLDLNR